jgi:hypothetical protein
MEKIKENIKNYFKGLTFKEKEHKYFYEEKPINKSVSGLIENYYPKFDSKAVSEKIAQFKGVSPEELRASWKMSGDTACNIGNKAHLFGEFYPYNRNMIPETGMEKAIVSFWESLPDFIVPFQMELRMFHKDFLFAGTADILLLNTLNNTFYLADYKTNKDLFKNYKEEKMYSHFSELLNCPFNKYQLQLSYYQILFEQTGYKVAGRKLIHLKNDGTHIIYDTVDYTQVLLEDLKTLKIC